MSKKKIFISTLLSCLFVVFSVVSFAYFSKIISIETPHNISTELTTENVTVSTVEQFYDAIRYYDNAYNTSITDKFNSNQTISVKRKKIILTDNIKLTADALVTADCHINLNKNTIDLNGYNLVFKHQFEGTFAVYNGTISDLSEDIIIRDETGNITSVEKPEYGKVIIDCPNACIDINVTYGSMITTNVKSASPDQVVNSAMKLVYSNLQNGTINDFYNTIDAVEDFGKDICNNSFTHTTDSHSCIYTYNDLDLIHNYFAYDGLDITYESSNTNILTNGGKVLTNSNTTTVPLTVTIKYKYETTVNDETITQYETIAKVIDVHIVAQADYAKASNNILLQYLENYYDATNNKYVFDKTFQLPKRNEYFDTIYTYTLLKQNPDNSISTISSNAGDVFFEDAGELFSVALSKDIIGMTITSTDSNGNSSTIDGLVVEGEASSVIDDNYSYAVSIVQNLYGNQIIIKDGQNNTESGYSEHQLLIDHLAKGYSRLTGMSNKLVNNNDNTYMITQYAEGNKYEGTYELLQVNPDSDVMPYLGQTVYLAITFDFVGGDKIIIQIPIVFEPLEDGHGFDPFDPYYIYFDKQFSEKTKNYSYESFDIPLTYEGQYPTYAYIIYVENENGTFTRIENDDPLFDLTISNGTYVDLNKDMLMNVEIDPYYIKPNDTKYHFAYIPIYVNTQDTVIYYTKDGTKTNLNDVNVDVLNYPYISTLTIPGIVRYNQGTFTNEVFADLELYEIAYNLINCYEISDANLSNAQLEVVEQKKYKEGKYILSSTLGNFIEKVDFSSTSPLLSYYGYSFEFGTIINSDEKIGSLKGLEKLTGIHELTFANTNLGAQTYFMETLNIVSQITNLNKLNLSGTGIYDQASGTLSFPDGNDNEFLTIISSLNNLKHLDLSNNKIYSFTALNSFASLEYVNIGGNTFTANSGYDFLNNIITPLINSLYGTNGATNAAVIAELRANGVTVQGTTNSEIPEGTRKVVDALSSLEYQDRVSKNIPLNTVLGQYSTLPSVYGIEDYVIDKVQFKFTTVNLVCGTLNTDGTYSGDVLNNGAYSATTFRMVIKCTWVYSPEGFFEGIVSGTQTGTIEFTYDYKVTRY